MRCQEEEGDHVPRLGTRAGSTLLFSTTTRFCDIKQGRNCSFLTSSSIAITSLTIRSSGVLLETGRVFFMRFIVGVISYMEVSSETSDIRWHWLSRVKMFVSFMHASVAGVISVGHLVVATSTMEVHKHLMFAS